MKSLKEAFETELFNRIDQRLGTNDSIEKSMLHALRYYDLMNKSFTDFKIFQKFVAKYGIQVYDVDQLQQIFNSYDYEGNGEIHHKILVARLLGRPDPESLTTTVQGSQLLSPMSSIKGGMAVGVDPQAVEKLLDVLSYKLSKQGISSILKLSAEFVESDKSGEAHVDLDTTLAIFAKLKIDMSPEDIGAVFRYLEVPGIRGRMDYSLLVKDLTAGFNNHRRGVVRNTFDRLDYLDTGKFDIRILKELFNARNHYDVKNGRNTSEDIISDFFACLNSFVRTQNGSGIVGSETFLDFWKQVSPNIENDYNFEAFLKNCFRYNELPRKNKLNPPNMSNSQREAPIYDKERYLPRDSIKYTMFPSSDQNMGGNFIYRIFEHLRKQLTKKGPKGLMLLYRSFKCNDFDADGKLSCKEFIKSLHEVRVELLDKETISVFKIFDPSNTGFISIPEFMSSFIPELSPDRQAVVDELLDGLSGRGDRITYKAIKKMFYPRGHPDFLSGKRADYEIKEEFFLILDTFLSLSGGINDFIPRELMLQFLEIFSYAIEDERFFVMILRGTFRMNKLSFPPVDMSAGLSSSQYRDDQSVRSSHMSIPPYGINHGRKDQDFQMSPQKPQKTAQTPQTNSRGFAGDIPSPDPSPLQKMAFEKKQAPMNLPTPTTPPRIEEDSGVSPTVDLVISKIRSQIARNPRGFFGLERSFVLADHSKARTCNIEQLSNAFTENGVDLTNGELQIIYNFIAEGGSSINYLKLISECRGQMTQAREDMVSELFRKLDLNQSESLATEAVLRAFRPENHPDVLKRHTTEDAIYDDFVDKFDLFGRLGGYDFQNGVIRFDEFLEFFDGLSALEQDDGVFTIFLRRCFA